MGVLQLEPIKRSTLTTEEVARYLGVSVDMVYIMCREKRIPHFRIGRRILFRKNVINDWITEQMEMGNDGQ